jgi:hypothetical protein
MRKLRIFPPRFFKWRSFDSTRSIARTGASPTAVRRSLRPAKGSVLCSTAEDARNCSRYLDGSGGLRPADGRFPARTRLRGVAGPYALATFKRRRTEAGAGEQVGAAGHPPSADHRCNGGDRGDQGAAACGKFLARADDGVQTKDSGRTFLLVSMPSWGGYINRTGQRQSGISNLPKPALSLFLK